MFKPSQLLAFLCLLLAAPVWAQPQFPQNPVYVSGGPFIYNVQDGTLSTVYDATKGPIYGVATTGSAYTGPYFSSLAVGPDNVDIGANGNAAHLFLLYACDSKTNTILRFDPTSGGLNPTAEVLSVAVSPTCGRFTSTGDFYFTSGNQVYEIKGAASIKFGTGAWASAAVTPVALTGTAANANLQGTTQKNVGDLLVVDQANNAVLRSPYANPFSTASTYINSGLSSPVGIARTSTGDVFISNSGTSNVAHFSTVGGPMAGNPCSALSFPGGTTDTNIFSVAASETDTIYAVSSVANTDANSNDFTEDLDFQAEGDNPGAVWSWSATSPNNCNLTQVASSGTVLLGVAVAPVATAPIPIAIASSAAPTTTVYNYNSSQFQLVSGGGCTATTTANPLSLANIGSMIQNAKNNVNGNLPNGATPIVNLGEEGYEIGYTSDFFVKGCTPDLGSPASFGMLIFGLYDESTAPNPVVIQCDDEAPNGSPSDEPFLDAGTVCKATTFLGAYPLGGPIPNDGGGGGRSSSNSVFFLANANPPSNAAEDGQYCNFLPPNGLTFDLDDFIVIAFQIKENGGSCVTGPFVGDATVNTSIAETSPSFTPILQLKPQGATFQKPSTYPIPCKTGSHLLATCTYALVVNLKASGITTPGTYELAVTSANAGTKAITFTLVNSQ